MAGMSYSERVDELMARIEDAVDTLSVDVDCEFNGGVLTMVCENGSSIIVSRQSAVEEVWLAAKSGGFHYIYDEESGEWVSTKGDANFADELEQATLAQAGEALKLA